MSEPMASTDRTRDAMCTLCGGPVVERMYAGLYGSYRWIKTRHTSPCGLPCFAAGVDLKVYKAGQFHAGFQKCPTCKPGSKAREPLGGES